MAFRVNAWRSAQLHAVALKTLHTLRIQTLHTLSSSTRSPSEFDSNPQTLNPAPYTLHPTPYTLHHTPYTLHHTPYTPHPTPHTLHPHPTANTFNPSLTPYTAHRRWRSASGGQCGSGVWRGGWCAGTLSSSCGWSNSACGETPHPPAHGTPSAPGAPRRAPPELSWYNPELLLLNCSQALNFQPVTLS